jgi:hypothetical protein
MNRKRVIAVGVIGGAALVAGFAMPANAANVGLVSAGGSNTTGTVTGNCAYAISLPATSFNTIPIAFTGEATSKSNKATVVPISTSIRCYLRNSATGSAGITTPGSAAAIAGQGNVSRLALDPEICTVVSAAFSDGTSIDESKTCHNL